MQRVSYFRTIYISVRGCIINLNYYKSCWKRYCQGGTPHIYQLKQSRKRKARKSQRMGSEKTKRQKKRAGLQQTKHGIAKECSPKKNAWVYGNERLTLNAWTEARSAIVWNKAQADYVCQGQVKSQGWAILKRVWCFRIISAVSSARFCAACGQQYPTCHPGFWMPEHSQENIFCDTWSSNAMWPSSRVYRGEYRQRIWHYCNFHLSKGLYDSETYV